MDNDPGRNSIEGQATVEQSGEEQRGIPASSILMTNFNSLP